MRFQKTVASFLTLIMCLCLCSCGNADIDSDPLLKAPRLPGETYKIQQALNSAINGPYTLKYPSFGQYKSAVTLVDITGDGNKEAVALYATTINDVTSISLNVLIDNDGKWYSASDTYAYASSVDQIDFRDLNNDGKPEILVGWVSGPADKQLSVYSFEKGSLVQRLQQSYASFLCCDLDSDKTTEVLLVTLDTATATARATLYSFAGSEVKAFGSCSLDGGVTSHNALQLAKLTDGRPAVYIDAPKGAGMISEIIYIKNNFLVNGAFDSQSNSLGFTWRNYPVLSADVNGDSVPDIPLISEFSGNTSTEGEKPYITNWHSFGPDDSKKVLTAYMDYTDKYAFSLPSGWAKGVTCEYDTKKHLVSFYEWNNKKSKRGKLLLQISTVALGEWGKSTYNADGFEKIASSDTNIYAAKIYNSDSRLAISVDTVKKQFKIIDWE